MFSIKLTKKGWSSSRYWSRNWEEKVIYGRSRYFYDFYCYSYKINDVVFTTYSADFQDAVDKEIMWGKLSGVL